MRCRDATPPDAAHLKALHVSSWRTAYAAFAPADLFGAPLEAEMTARWDAWPEGRLIRVVTTEQDEIMGFAATEFRPHPYLDNLHIDPDHKRSGLGHTLLADHARCLLDMGQSSLALTVIDDNAPARAFYARCGGVESEGHPETLLGHPIVAIPVTWDAAALARLSLGTSRI